ncbi:MAG: FHA domain-containing protein [Tepidisphaerales bacterium]
MSAIPTGVPPLPPVPPHAAEGSGSQLPGPHPVLAPLNDPRVLPLDRPVTLAGSGPRCRLNLRSSTVSKVHAIFIRDGATVYVRDLASREGVKVDGEPIRECLLTGGEKITIGRFEFVFEAVASSRLPRRAPSGTLQGIEIESRTFLIGRRNTADLVLDREEVSSAHALLLEYNGRRYLRDLGSRTGVLLNGHRVQWEYLKSGDVITIAGQELVYVEDEPVKFEPRMRLNTPTSSVLLGPNGSVEQATFLSENLSEQLLGVSSDDSVAGSIEATPADSAVALSFGGTGADAGPAATPAVATETDAAPDAPPPVADDPVTPWGTAAGGVAFDDGTPPPTEDETGATKKAAAPANPAEAFSSHLLPVTEEPPGLETLVPVPASADPLAPTASDAPPVAEPADVKPSPLPFDPLAGYDVQLPAAAAGDTLAGGGDAAPPLPTTTTSTVTSAAGAAADDFESLLAGLDVAVEAVSSTPLGAPSAAGPATSSFASPAESDTDERAFAPPPAIDVAEGITLELTFDDPPPTPEAATGTSDRLAHTQETEPQLTQETAANVTPLPHASAETASDTLAAATPPQPAPTTPPEPTGATAEPPAAPWPPLAAPDSPLVTGAAGLTRRAVETTTTAGTAAGPAIGQPPTAGASAALAVSGQDVGPSEGRDRQLGERFDRMLRGEEPLVVEDESRDAVRGGARFLTTLARWLVIGALVAAAAYAGWSLAAPVPMVEASVRVPAGLTSTSVLTAEPVRRRAVQRLAEQHPGVSPGVLRNEALLQTWAEAAKLEAGQLTLRVVGDADDVKRAEALLWAVGGPADGLSGVSAEQARSARQEQLAAAEAALAAAEKRLADARERVVDAETLSALATEVRAAEKQRDQLAARLDSLRASAPSRDQQAQRTLDRAVAAFEAQLEATRNQPSADERLSRFVAAVQRVEEQGAELMDDILTRREEQARRLQSLRRRLDERMRIRQQQAWDNDATLKQLTADSEAVRRRLNDARERNDLTAATDLAGELDYYEGLIKSRKALIGTDRGDERALAELQSIIEEQAQATEADRQRLASGFESMRQAIVSALPELSTLPDSEFRLAAELETRLSELQAARANLAESAAAAQRQHQEAVAQLEAELDAATAKLVELGERLETTRTAQPQPAELKELEARVQAAREAVQIARSAMESAEGEPADLPAARLVTADAGYRPYVAAGAGLVTLALLSPLMRSRRTQLDELT